ncbi:MAG: hypothetical protein J1E57_05570 [Prevotella sp.]|nr:hypothetical protein [Prevotella sp.]
MEEQLKEKNPWEHLTEGKVKIAKRDVPFFEEWAKKNNVKGEIDEIVKAYAEKINAKTWINKKTGETKNVELTFDCLPDPFGGNPDSKVYCLNLNPGKPDDNFKEVDKFKKACKKNLRLDSDTCYWAEGTGNDGKEHTGTGWLHDRTREIEEILNEDCSGEKCQQKYCLPDIFFIEYFPYHSTSGFYFPRKKLKPVKNDKDEIVWQLKKKKNEKYPYPASYDFSDQLIKQAMTDKKMIIIMRAKGDWLERIEGLADYENLYVLSSPQCGYLTSRNIMNYKTGKRLEDEENYKEIIKKYFKI